MLDVSQHEDEAPLVVESYDMGMLRMEVAIGHIVTIHFRTKGN